MTGERQSATLGYGDAAHTSQPRPGRNPPPCCAGSSRNGRIRRGRTLPQLRTRSRPALLPPVRTGAPGSVADGPASPAVGTRAGMGFVGLQDAPHGRCAAVPARTPVCRIQRRAQNALSVPPAPVPCHFSPVLSGAGTKATLARPCPHGQRRQGANHGHDSHRRSDHRHGDLAAHGAGV